MHGSYSKGQGGEFLASLAEASRKGECHVFQKQKEALRAGDLRTGQGGWAEAEEEGQRLILIWACPSSFDFQNIPSWFSSHLPGCLICLFSGTSPSFLTWTLLPFSVYSHSQVRFSQIFVTMMSCPSTNRGTQTPIIKTNIL